MIQAVFFDVGSTLITSKPAIDGVFHEKALERGHAIDLAEVSSHMPLVDEFYESEYLKDGDFWCSPEGSQEIYLEMYRYLAHLCNLEHDAEGIAQKVHDAYLRPAYWSIYADVIPCLKALKEQRLRLAVVSNWSSNLENLLRGLKLIPYFDEVIASADVGYRKPDPLIFTLTLERMGLQPSEVIHVGDRPDADGEGAQAAGITPVIIDRANEEQDTGFHRVSSLEQLPVLIQKLQADRSSHDILSHSPITPRSPSL